LCLPAFGISGRLKQSTAVTLTFGPMVDATDGTTPMPSLVVTADKIRLSKNGGAFAAKNSATAQTYMENGFYTVALDATDAGTLGRLTVKWFDATVAAGCWTLEYEVVTANAWDSDFSTAIRPVNVTQWTGTAVATPDTAGCPKVTVKAGTGTGELNLTSGRVDSNVTYWNGSTNGIANWVKIYSTDFTGWYDDVNDLANSRVYVVSKAAALANISEVQGKCELAIEAKKATVATEVQTKMDSSSTDLNSLIGVVVTKLDTALEVDGATYRLTTNSLEQAPTATAATDWTAAEREQVRSALGIDGTKTAAAGGHLQTVKGATDKLDTALEVDGAVYRLTANSVEQAPSSTGSGLTQLGRATAQGGTVSTVTLAATASAINNIYRGNRIVIYGGDGSGQTNLITSYDGPSRVARVLIPWVINPTATSQYEMQAADGEILRMLGGGWE
jgi:hypothetical protein